MVCRLDIPGVGKVEALPGGDDHHALSMKAHGIKLSGLTGEQHGVDTVFGQLGRDLF